MEGGVKEGDKFHERWMTFGIHAALETNDCLGEAFTPGGGWGFFGLDLVVGVREGW